MICSDNWHKYHESSDISQLLYVRNCATKESFNLSIISSKIKKEKERKKERTTAQFSRLLSFPGSEIPIREIKIRVYGKWQK